ncbi:uncharacterized protein CTRU02_202220 [Colletotrichum truncatum]|uniref:Uncharacterized protein n=1 Tax=Colletotrichum truncatum TaxID=5467 RepID=A0ACC3ZJQ3_COLTU|nr:uncharacterized protein CTRU02_01381 [Colletotrichum truncatum]KAF6799702.1 hypothetical protein CTRU02_01381 [Colletotrichum truncatum]
MQTGLAKRISHVPRQALGLNSTTTSTGLISPSSQDTFSINLSTTQGETSSTSQLVATSFPSASPSQQPTTSGSYVPGGTLSGTGEPSTGRISSATSDEISSQIVGSSSTVRPVDSTTHNTVIISPSELPNTASTRNLTSTVSLGISSHGLTTIVRTNSSASISSGRSTTSSSASFSGNFSRPSTTFIDTIDENQVVTLTLPTGYEPKQDCISTSEGAIPTTWSIVYTSTTTFYGNPTEYTPPFPEITIPATCTPLNSGGGRSRPPISGAFCAPSVAGGCSSIEAIASYALTMVPSSPKVVPAATFTFVTTAKNPSVIYLPISTPRYGNDPETKAPQDKQTALKPPPDQSTDKSQPPPSPPAPPRESVKEPPKATYTVTVAPTKVIINDQTFTITSPSETTRVTVDGAQFTINPSEVAGGGTVVNRPGNVGRRTLEPTSTMVGELPVVIAPDGAQNAVVVGGTTFELQSTPVTAVVQDQTITVQSSRIIFPDQTVSISRSSPVQTEIVVAGGEMLTVIGRSILVIRSTTITYGPESSTITEIVDDDTIIIGPTGVTVHNVTMGGPNATPSDTFYEIVGGATITQVGASLVVLKGTTFTVGPGRGTTTTVVGGETIIIGPSGVAVSTLTFSYPFGPTVITTISVPTATAAPAPVPSETKTNGGAGVRHAGRATGVSLEFCIAIGVWVLGRMV